MGYKNVKEHYDIKHIVEVCDEKQYGGRCICIGSPYRHDIIVIRIHDAKVVKQYNEYWNPNENLARYNEALKKDEKNGVLRKLIETPDTFTKSLPVFTIEKGMVIRDVCEEYGYPNTTHAGAKMYENTHFETRKEAYAYLLETTSNNIRYCQFKRNIKDCFERIVSILKYGFLDVVYWVKARTISRFYTKKYNLKN
jgi:hypothetical protein